MEGGKSMTEAGPFPKCFAKAVRTDTWIFVLIHFLSQAEEASAQVTKATARVSTAAEKAHQDIKSQVYTCSHISQQGTQSKAWSILT